MIREISAIIFISILLAGCISAPGPENGTLQLTSSPSGAEIYLDNQYRGSTPSTVPGVQPGNHTIEFRLAGYRHWKAEVTVPPGISNFYASLSALEGTGAGPVTIPETSAGPVTVNVRVSRDQFIVGDSVTFSGTATGTDSITLILYGPGKYQDGIILDTVKPGPSEDWRFTWNPGDAIRSGTYTIIARNAEETLSDRADFTAIGNGVVTVTPGSYAVIKGETVLLSGRCTTNAPSVRLVLFGPERFGSGVDLGTISVMGDQTWSYRYVTDLTMPTGIYTAYVSDVPKTASGTTQFTIGYAS